MCALPATIGVIISSRWDWNLHPSSSGCRFFIPTGLGLGVAPLPVTTGIGGGYKTNDIQSFWSYHTGGLHFLMADGAVRFVSNSLDYNSYQSLATRAGGEVVGEF